MALLDLATALARLPDDEHSRRIRMFAADAADGTADTTFRVVRLAQTVNDLEPYHHDALIALLADERGTAGQAVEYANDMRIVATPDQIDTLISLVARPGEAYASENRRPFATLVAQAFPFSLSEAQHGALLDVICHEGSVMDAETYVFTFRGEMTPGLYDKVIQLFRRDTYHGPQCAANFVREKTLTTVHQASLIAAITGGVRGRYTVYHLREFLRDIRDLSPHLVGIILDAMDKHHATADDYRFVAECGTTLTLQQEERIRIAIATREAPHARVEAFEPLDPFDPDANLI